MYQLNPYPCFFFLSLPHVLFPPLFSFSLPPNNRNSEPGSHAKQEALLPSLVPTTALSRENCHQSSALPSLVDSRLTTKKHESIATPKYFVSRDVGAVEAFYDKGSPFIFRGSSLEELHTSPEKGLQRTSNCTPMTNSMTQVYKNIIIRNKIGIPTIFGRSLRHSDNVSAGNVLPLS